MSYGPGRSRLLQGTLIGAGAWVVGFALTALSLLVVFDVFIEAELGRLFVTYALITIWPVLAAAMWPGPFWDVLLAMGATTALLFVAGGALTLSRVETVDSSWNAAKVGATIGIGHVLAMAGSFVLASAAVMDGFPGSTRTVMLVFGGFVVPAVCGAAGGVIWYLRD